MIDHFYMINHFIGYEGIDMKEEDALKIVIEFAKTKDTDYIDEGVFVNKFGMYHCCRPLKVINVKDFKNKGSAYCYNPDPELTKQHFGTLYKETLQCDNCKRQISKNTVMVALLRGKGQKWLG